MAATCYRCDKWAKYTCDAPGCEHQMCHDHGALSIPARVDPPPDGDIEERDHQHLRIDHVAPAQA